MSFADALAVTLKHEGGFSDHPADRGGRTNKGITQSVYDDWRMGQSLVVRSVEHIDPDEVRSIYHQLYWTPAKCDLLPEPLDELHFDAAVNHGVNGATRILQYAVGVTVDGKHGPITQAAIDSSDDTLPFRLVLSRIRYYRNIVRRDPSQLVFLMGWLNRVLALESSL